jgi:hypothetical protein
MISWKESILKSFVPGTAQFNLRMHIHLFIWGVSLIVNEHFHIRGWLDVLFIREEPIKFLNFRNRAAGLNSPTF